MAWAGLHGLSFMALGPVGRVLPGSEFWEADVVRQSLLPLHLLHVLKEPIHQCVKLLENCLFKVLL